MKRQHMIMGGMAFVVAAILVAGGAIALAKKAATPSAKPSPTAKTEAARPSPSTSPTEELELPPSPTPSKTTAKPTPPPKSDCARLVGKNQSYEAVEAALNKAAAQPFWTETKITIPRMVVQAVAWQETGWQSACRSADGGIGVMQVQQETADHINSLYRGRMIDLFGRTLDPGRSLHDATMLGSFQLQILAFEIGKAKFGGKFDFSPALCTNRRPCLLNAVISAYQAGAGAVLAEMGDGDAVLYPNAAEYVDNVRVLMKLNLPKPGVPLPQR